MKAFWVSDEEIYAANSLEEAIAAYKADTGYEEGADFCLEDCRELTDEELDKEIPDFDEDEQLTGTMTTKRKWLSEMTEPGYLCGTVY